ncbi:MAG: endopeptidase La [Ardenticatenales bacterium]
MATSPSPVDPTERPSAPIAPTVPSAPIIAADEEEEGSPKVPDILPILPLRSVVVFPMAFQPVAVGQPRSVQLAEDVAVGERMVGLVLMTDPSIAEPGPEGLHVVGTAAHVHRMVKGSEGNVGLFVQGLERFRIDEWVATEPYLKARITLIPDPPDESVAVEALRRGAVEMFQRLIELVPQLPEELGEALERIDDPRALSYFIASNTRMEAPEAQKILAMETVQERLRALMAILGRELEVLELGKKIQSEARGEMEKMQREFFLRQQLRAIKKELGEEEGEAELEQLKVRITESGMPSEAEKEALRELARLESLPEAAAEYGVIRTYLDWMVGLPWQVTTPDNLDIHHARVVLDEDHYDLEDVKQRILEVLAVQKLRVERAAADRASAALDDVAAPDADPIVTSVPTPTDAIAGAILCLVGPPGVGKTSLGRSIARALGRQFVRMSLGGLRDEAEIRGHRRTYVGAMPGRLIQGIKRAGTRNPVFILDEIDKVGSNMRGDPESALLEVLDPAQNHEFRDLYLDVPFDLSDVLFICTANELGQISGPLRDRLEIIDLAGYTETDKLHIARDYLIARQLADAGLRPGELEMTDAAIRELIRHYTREAGVRNLEREIGKVARKVAVRVAAAEEPAGAMTIDAATPGASTTGVRSADGASTDAKAAGAMTNGASTTEAPTTVTSNDAASTKVAAPFVVVDVGDLAGYLRAPRFFDEVAERTSIAGVATGLAYTPFGGDVLFIEASAAPGAKGFTLTGQLGDVMKESAQAALSYVRAHGAALGLADDYFASHDIHIHVPAGATPKDGPSAGVTMATALASLLTGRPVRSDVAMTGEMTLRGKVLPVGGIKEKVLAAHRAGIKTVILPQRNRTDIEDVPEDVAGELTFVYADTIDDVWANALEDPAG